MASWLNLSTINALRDRFGADVAALKADEDLTSEAKARRAREMAAAFEAAYRAEKEELERAMEQRRHTLTKKAYPAEELGADVQRALLEEMVGQRMERDIATQAEAGGFDPVRALEDARYRGDAARQAVLERVGRRYLPDDPAHRERFSELVEKGRQERMSPGQRAALGELEAFEHQQGELGQALSLADRAVRRQIDAVYKEGFRPDAARGLNNLSQVHGGYPAWR